MAHDGIYSAPPAAAGSGAALAADSAASSAGLSTTSAAEQLVVPEYTENPAGGASAVAAPPAATTSASIRQDLRLLRAAATRSPRSKAWCALASLVFIAAFPLVGLSTFLEVQRNSFYTSVEQEDTTPATVLATTDAGGRDASVLSAYFGLDDALPENIMAACKGAAGKDGSNCTGNPPVACDLLGLFRQIACGL